MFEDLTLEMSVAKMFRNRQDPQDQQEESGTTPNSQLAIVNNGTTKINLNNGTRTGGDESQSHSVLSSTAAPNEPCKSAPCDFGMIGGLLCSEKASPKACNLDDNRIPHSALEELVRNDLWDDEAKSQLISPIVNANALTEGNNEVLKSSEITCTAPPVFNADEDASKVEYSMNVSDYKLDDAIGYGSSAVVHLALYIPTQAYVAVKIIDLERFERNQIDTLRREIQVMSLCRHPNLLRVLASFVHESHLWIVTPFLAAGSCLDLLRTPQFQTGILDEVAIATILQQALQGLEYLHQNGHIHRDIKAGNLLVDMDGQVQLADFGVSSSLLDNAGGRQGDVRKTFVGTPCWMAPEVMEMTKGYDAKADIWSFGITAYELATGSAPFAKLPPMKVIYMTLSNDPPKLNRYRETIKFSKAFKDLISSCLQKDPSKRFSLLY